MAEAAKSEFGLREVHEEKMTLRLLWDTEEHSRNETLEQTEPEDTESGFRLALACGGPSPSHVDRSPRETLKDLIEYV